MLECIHKSQVTRDTRQAVFENEYFTICIMGFSTTVCIPLQSYLKIYFTFKYFDMKCYSKLVYRLRQKKSL